MRFSIPFVCIAASFLLLVRADLSPRSVKHLERTGTVDGVELVARTNTCKCPPTSPVGGKGSNSGSDGATKGNKVPKGNGNVGPSSSLKGILQSGNCHTKSGFVTSLDTVFESFHKDVSASLTFLSSEEVKTCSAAKLEKKLKVVHEACGELSTALQWLVTKKISFSASSIFALEASIKSTINVLLVQFADAIESIEELDAALLVKFSSLLSELDVSLGSIISSLQTCLTGSVNICQSKVTTLSSALASLSAKIELFVKKSSKGRGKGHFGHSHGPSVRISFNFQNKGSLFNVLKGIFGSSFGSGFKTCDA